ncbi:MAG: glycosyltransferase family 9 protein [Planctomycetota bacterium]|jgi:lipopolysaccharide heptosyltransferase I
MIAHRNEHVVPRHVLIVKPSALGDVVTAVPVLRALKRTFPQVRVAWMLSDTCAPLVAHDSQLDEVILFRRRQLGKAWRSVSAAANLWQFTRRLRKLRYDWIVDLQGLLRSSLLGLSSRAPLRAGFADAREAAWLFYTRRHRPDGPHTVDRNIAVARYLGLDARPEDMTLDVSAEGREFAEGLRDRSGLTKGKYIVCVPPTRWQSKRYPVRHWRRVVSQLSDDLPVVLLGTPQDKDLCRRVGEGMGSAVVDLAGQTNVSQMVGVIAASSGVVCCDSAAKFIAPAVGVDVVTLMGPTKLERTGPYGLGRAIVADVACQGCLRRRCRPAVCMELIDPDEVVSAARDMIARRRT